MRYLWIILTALLLSACTTSGYVDTTTTAIFVQIKGERATLPEAKACEYAGGQVQRVGMLGYDMCVIPYADGRKVCTDGSQCQGQCRTDNFDAYNKTITGQCQINNSPFGCYAEVTNGKGAPALCVD